MSFHGRFFKLFICDIDFQSCLFLPWLFKIFIILKNKCDHQYYTYCSRLMTSYPSLWKNLILNMMQDHFWILVGSMYIHTKKLFYSAVTFFTGQGNMFSSQFRFLHARDPPFHLLLHLCLVSMWILSSCLCLGGSVPVSYSVWCSVSLRIVSFLLQQ